MKVVFLLSTGQAQNDNENEDLIFMEIAFGPCGRRTRFVGYCFSLYMATALGQLVVIHVQKSPAMMDFIKTQIAVNCP